MRYWATFKGWLIGAQGIFDRHSRMCEGSTPREAELDLYTSHEHISELTLNPVLSGIRAKQGDRIEPIDEEGKPTGIRLQVLGVVDESSITTKNVCGVVGTVPRDNDYIFWV